MTFDLEKARDLATNPIHCPETDEIFVDAIAEIERLRTENRELLHEIKDLSRIIDTGYEQLVCDRTGLNERQNLPEGISRMAASVQELEDALVEERAEHICQDYGHCDHDQKHRDSARQQLLAEGKIGPDAALKKQWDDVLAEGKISSSDHSGEANKLIGLNADHPYPAEAPRSWQVTEEREKAIRDLSGISRDIGCDKCHPFIQKYYGHSIQVLRAMLEASQ